MLLYGREWTRRQLEARVGRIEQLAGVQRFTLSEGPESGVEQIRVRTGSGLSFHVTPSKGLDISLAEYGGFPISWQSVNGDAHPSLYDASGSEWLRTASGGLLMTCGLTQVGSACEDAGEKLGLHGRVHHTPARSVYATSQWIDDEYEMTVGGIVEEVSIFGGCLQLTRKITSRLGQNTLWIEDEVRNIGFKRCPHMILYHFNFGFPLMTEQTKVIFSGGEPQAREAGVQTSGYGDWQAPDPNCEERVFYHSAAEGRVEIVNPEFPTQAGQSPINVALSWSTDTLPRLVQWKMPGAGTHVLGIEPANCSVGGRVAEREAGTLTYLEPGETRSYKLELKVQ
ncbi:aldose 1-epimerase family protein [Cohnella abietis]|uniref:DUF4432 domain-containing protein n=1 Tax=Cohnella abietis TaxID=2507935 RepID=A0A3T1D4F8_9BACL|nr:aldose 1-epimerase family protein [Cohnella abietis]BBI32899.1 DUF4432 domain-containing protein [Cohnella abietis]